MIQVLPEIVTNMTSEIKDKNYCYKMDTYFSIKKKEKKHQKNEIKTIFHYQYCHTVNWVFKEIFINQMKEDQLKITIMDK